MRNRGRYLSLLVTIVAAVFMITFVVLSVAAQSPKTSFKSTLPLVGAPEKILPSNKLTPVEKKEVEAYEAGIPDAPLPPIVPPILLHEPVVPQMVMPDEVARNSLQTLPKNQIAPTDFMLTEASTFPQMQIVNPSQTVIYSNDFEGAVGNEWSAPITSTTPIYSYGFLGEFVNDVVTLSLGELPSHNEVTVSFDLFTIGSWDGIRFDNGPDIWDVSVVDGPTLLHTTFAIWDTSDQSWWQNYPDEYPGSNLHYPRTGSDYDLGYSQGVAYELSFTFPHTGTNLALNFSASGLSDELWGVDNVVVAVDTVTQPSCGPDLAGGWQTAVSLPLELSTPFNWAGKELIFHDGRVYIFGGKNAAEFEQTAIYASDINPDGSLAGWATVGSLPQPYIDYTVLQANDFVYLLTGADGQYDVWYSPIADLDQPAPWQMTTHIPTSRQGFGAAIYNDYLYIGGGGDLVQYAAIDPVLGTIGTWQDAPNLPAPAYDNTVVMNDGTLYVIAQEGAIYYAPINLDGSVGSWVTAANSLPFAAYRFTTFVNNGFLYTVGGTDNFNSDVFYAPLSTDGSVGAWQTTTAPLPTGDQREGMWGGIYNCTIYAVGGHYPHSGDSGIYYDTIYYATLQSETLPANILLVDNDDSDPDYLAAYEQALADFGARYDVWDIEANGEPQTDTLAAYDTVIWFSGGAFTAVGPSPSAESDLAAWLDEGGKSLFISSQDYHYARGLTPFMTDYLGVTAVADDMRYLSVNSTGPLSNFSSYGLLIPLSDLDDAITGTVSAETFFYTEDYGYHTAAIGYEVGSSRTTFWGFPFEAMDDLDAAEIMQATLNWLANEVRYAGPTSPGSSFASLNNDYTISANAEPVVVLATMVDEAGYPIQNRVYDIRIQDFGGLDTIVGTAVTDENGELAFTFYLNDAYLDGGYPNYINISLYDPLYDVAITPVNGDVFLTPGSLDIAASTLISLETPLILSEYGSLNFPNIELELILDSGLPYKGDYGGLSVELFGYTPEGYGTSEYLYGYPDETGYIQFGDGDGNWYYTGNVDVIVQFVSPWDGQEVEWNLGQIEFQAGTIEYLSNTNAYPLEVLADGIETTTISATLLDSFSNVVPDRTVQIWGEVGSDHYYLGEAASSSDGDITFSFPFSELGYLSPFIYDPFYNTYHYDFSEAIRFVSGPVDPEHTNTTITVGPNPAYIYADEVMVDMQLYTVSGQPASFREFELYLDGNPMDSDTTDEEGYLTFYLYPQTPGDYEISLYDVEYDFTLSLGTLTVLAGPVDLFNSTITAVPDTIASDGIAASIISATLQDTYGNPITDRQIGWVVNGNLTGWNYLADATTNSNGIVTHTLTWETPEILEVIIYDSLPGNSYNEYLYTGTYINTTAAGAIDPISSTIELTPTEVLASNVDTAVLSATLRDEAGTLVTTRTVSLLLNGYFQQSTLSDANGQINFALSSAAVQTVTVALQDSLYDTVIPVGQVLFVAGPVDADVSRLISDKTVIVADTLDSATLTATLYDAYNHPIAGKEVVIQANGSGISLTQPISQTDAQGRVQAVIRAATAQTVTITAHDLTDNLLLSQTADLTFLPAPPDLVNSTIVVSPTTAIADDVQTVVVSATLRDAANRPISGRQIALEVTGLGYTILPQPVYSTNDDGRIFFNLTATYAQQKTLSLYDAETDTTLPVGQVDFIPGPVDPFISQLSVIGSNLARADGTDVITIRVRAYDAFSNPVPGATVSLTSTDQVILTQPPVTDENGLTTGTVASSQVGAFTIEAWVNDVLLDDVATATFITADLAVGKTRSGQAYANFPLTYTLDIANVGLLTATDVIFTDTLPVGLNFVTQDSALSFNQTGQLLTWQAGNIGPGDSIAVVLVVEPDVSLPDGTIVSNELAASTSAVELNEANNTAVAQHDVKQPAPQLSVYPGQMTLHVPVGGSANASLTVRNSGLISMTGTTINIPDTLPGLSATPLLLPDVAPGQQTAVNFEAADASVPAGAYRDFVTLTEDSGGEQRVILTVNHLPISRSLQLSVTNDQGQIVPGTSLSLQLPNGLVNVVQGITTTVNVNRSGRTSSNGALLFQTLPVGVYQYTASARNHDTQTGVISVTAGSGIQVETVTLTARPLLSVAPLSPIIVVAPGQTNSQEIVITNRGAAPLTDVLVTPPPLHPWIYKGTPSTGISTLAPGESMRVSIYASPSVDVPANVYNQYVTVSGSGQQQSIALTVNITAADTRDLEAFVGKQINGEPLANAQVILTQQEASLLVTQGVTTTYNQQFVERTDAAGLASFSELPVGSYNYVINRPGYKRDTGILDIVPAAEGQAFIFNKYPLLKPATVQSTGSQFWNTLLYSNPFDIDWKVDPVDEGYEIELTITRDTGAEGLEMFVPTREWEFTSCAGGSLMDDIGVFNISSELITLEDVVIDVPGVETSITYSDTLPASSTGIVHVSATSTGELSQGTIVLTGTYHAVHTNTVSYTFNPSSFTSQNLLSGQEFTKGYQLSPVIADPNVAYTFVITQPAAYEWMNLQTTAVSPINLSAGTPISFALAVTPPIWLGEGVYEDRAAISFTDPDKDLTREGYLNIRVTKTEQGIIELHTNFELGPTPTTDIPITGTGDIIPRCDDGGQGSGSGSGFGWGWGWLVDGSLRGNWSSSGSGGGSGGGGTGSGGGYQPPFNDVIGDMITIEGEANQEVGMEISQQMMLEGEGFQATLVLTNRLPIETVNNISVDLLITDEAGNPANGFFEITPVVPTGLGDLSAGGATVGQWLLLPVNMNLTEANGRLFRVRAQMNYSVLGTPYTLHTVPRDFRVFPAPELIIDYELPGSDPELVCTDFDMRATVHNVGAGPARNIRFSVESLLINDGEDGAPRSFEILEVYLDDEPYTGDLTMNVPVGTVPPGESRSILWRLQPGSPGRFIEFTSDFSSSNYVGQSTTPRIREINTFINTNFAHDCTITAGPHSPDLIVEILELPEQIVVSETVDIDLRVTNLGTEIANAEVGLRIALYQLELEEIIDEATGNHYVDARWVEVSNETIPLTLNLEQDESEIHTHQITPPAYANYQLRVTIDPED